MAELLKQNAALLRRVDQLTALVESQQSSRPPALRPKAPARESAPRPPVASLSASSIQNAPVAVASSGGMAIGTAIGTQLNLQVILPPSPGDVRPWGTPESLRVTADQLRAVLLESEEVRRYLGLTQASRDVPENGERFAVAAIMELVDRVKSDPANENVWLDAGNTSQVVAVTPHGPAKLPFTEALELYSTEIPRQARQAAASADPPLAQSERDAISDLGMLCDPPPEALARPLKAHLANQTPARRAERGTSVVSVSGGLEPRPSHQSCVH